MKYTFFWSENEPCCQSDIVGNGEIDYVASLLHDNEGFNHDSPQVVAWLDEGLSRVKAVRDGFKESDSWGRDSWGVDFTMNSAKIYAMHDQDNFFAVIGTDELEDLLSQWRAFVLTSANK